MVVNSSHANQLHWPKPIDRDTTKSAERDHASSYIRILLATSEQMDRPDSKSLAMQNT